MKIITIKNKEDIIGLKNKKDLANENILIKISLSLYEELFADEKFYENESNECEAVRCPICGCSKFEGNINYVARMIIDDECKPNVYKTMDSEIDEEIYCKNCDKSYRLDH